MCVFVGWRGEGGGGGGGGGYIYMCQMMALADFARTLTYFSFLFSPLITLFFFLIDLFFSIMLALILKISHHIDSIHACKQLKPDSE